MKRFELESDFVRRVQGAAAQDGRHWLEGLGKLVSDCESRWGFQAGQPYPLSYNFVIPVSWRDGREAVLKLCLPGAEYAQELYALRQFNGVGMVKLLEANEERRVLLLEKLSPGRTLNTLQDNELETTIAAKLYKQLCREASAADRAALPDAARRFEGFARLRARYGGGSGPFSERLVSKVERLSRELCETISRPMLLHGDLHHENILSTAAANGELSWLAIDPKGLIGELEYETIQYMLNYVPPGLEEEITTQRIRVFVKELGLSEERLLMYGLCHSLLAAWWTVEEGGELPARDIAMAELFEQLLEA